MSNATVASAMLSRPKIHRPPAFVAQKTTPVDKSLFFMRRYAARRPVWFSLGALVALALLAALLNSFISLALRHISSLPRFADSSATGSIAVPDVFALTENSKKSAKIIVITRDEGSLIGQMTNLSTDTSQTAGVDTAVDKAAGRELLSIVSKY